MSQKRRHQKQAAPSQPDNGLQPEVIEAAPPPPPPPPKPLPTRPAEAERIGDILRRVRQQRGESLDDIASYICIRPTFLVALENSRYEELPADAYVIGFLRTYANHLGLDGKGAIDLYRREMAGRRRKPQLNMPQPVSEGQAPTAAILVGVTLAALLIYALWYALASSDRATVSRPPSLPASLTTTATPPTLAAVATPPAPAVVTTTPVLSATATLVTATATSLPTVPAPTSTPVATAGIALNATATAASLAATATPANAATATSATKGQTYGDTATRQRVALRVVKESWVLIADRYGNTVFDKILKPGDVYNVPNGKGLTLTTGNGGGIIMSVDGVDMPRLADDNRVVRNIALDPDQAKAKAVTPAD